MFAGVYVFIFLRGAASPRRCVWWWGGLPLKNITFEKILRYNTTMKREIITLTGIPTALIPPDTPTFLTDVTWENILINLQSGIPLTKTLSNMKCLPNVAGKVMTWIYKNAERKAIYFKALEIQTEILGQQILEISDGTYNDNPTLNDGVLVPEDIKRSALRIKTRTWLMQQNNVRFTPKTINTVVSVDLNKAMERAEKNVTNNTL